MSDHRNENDLKKPPLPTPVGEDGILHPKDDARQDDDVEDAGLAETGGGDPGERKII